MLLIIKIQETTGKIGKSLHNMVLIIKHIILFFYNLFIIVKYSINNV